MDDGFAHKYFLIMISFSIKALFAQEQEFVRAGTFVVSHIRVVPFASDFAAVPHMRLEIRFARAGGCHAHNRLRFDSRLYAHQAEKSREALTHSLLIIQKPEKAVGCLPVFVII